MTYLDKLEAKLKAEATPRALKLSVREGLWLIEMLREARTVVRWANMHEPHGMDRKSMTEWLANLTKGPEEKLANWAEERAAVNRWLGFRSEDNDEG